MNKFLASFLCFACLGCTSLGTSRDVTRTKESFPTALLPSMIIAYSLAVLDQNDFNCLWKPTGADQENGPFLKLSAEFKKLSPHIDMSFGFVKSAYIVQSDMPGQVSGLGSSDGEGADLVNLLFVTTPIKAMDDRILVFLSTMSPESTVIMSVDSQLNVQLLYSTFAEGINRIPEGESYTIMCSTYSIKAKETGLFSLLERKNNKCSTEEVERTFSVDVRNGKLRISRD